MLIMKKSEYTKKITKDDWKGYNGTRRNSMAEDEKLRSDGIDADEYRTQHGY